MEAEIGHHLCCIYLSCRSETYEGRADAPSVRIKLHLDIPSIRVPHKNKLSSTVPRGLFFPSLNLSQYYKQHSCALKKLLYSTALFLSIKQHKAMEDTAIMCTQVPLAETAVVQNVCLSLLNRPKPY